MAPGPVSDHLDYHRGRYNRVYGDESQTVFADRPGKFLVACLQQMKVHRGARALDLGAGNGRNTFAAAESGYAVTAIDISRVGLDHIRRVAAAGRWDIETVEADAYVAEYEPESIDLLIVIYFNIPAEMAKRLERAVRPGGAVVVEGYPGQTGLAMLQEQFANWHIVCSQTVEAVPDWNWSREARSVPILQFFARKP